MKDTTIMTKLEELEDIRNTIGISQNKCDSLYIDYIRDIPSCIHDYVFDYLFNDTLWVRHEIEKVLGEQACLKNEVTLQPCDDGFLINKIWSQSGNCSSMIVTKEEIADLVDLLVDAQNRLKA